MQQRIGKRRSMEANSGKKESYAMHCTDLLQRRENICFFIYKN